MTGDHKFSDPATFFSEIILIYSVPIRICCLSCVAEVSQLLIHFFLPTVRQMQVSEESSCLMPNTKGCKRKGSGEKCLPFHKTMLQIGFYFAPRDVSFGLHFPSEPTAA